MVCLWALHWSKRFVCGLFIGPSGLSSFCSASSTLVHTSSRRCFSKTSLNMTAMCLESSAGAYFRRLPGNSHC